MISKLLWFVFFISCSQLLSSSFSNSKNLCPGHQTLALLHLKHSFSIDNSSSWRCEEFYGVTSYSKTESWKEGRDCCSWDGVTCDTLTGHVTGIDLSCSWLYGTIHSNSTLFLFPHLRTLNLAFNNFNHSSVSAEFGRLSSLTHLNLSGSVFSGQITPEISLLSNLVSLDLSWNEEARLAPHDLNSLALNLTKLQKLHLGGMNISSHFPNSLLNLSSLTYLKLLQCGLRGRIPPSIGNLTQLYVLDLGYNQLEGLIPSHVNGLPNLSYLYLDYNSLNGAIPSWLFSLPSLKSLYLGGNRLNGHIGEFQYDSLEELGLEKNELQGSIPSSIFKLVNLALLYLSSNNLTGELSPQICKMSFMEVLDLSNNSLSGMLPQCLRNFSKSLSVLDFRMNNFHGTVPSPCSKGNIIRSLNFNDNQFEGPVPQSLINCRELEVLDLGNNKINDTFPHWLGTLPKLQILVLRSNDFYGEISGSKFKSPFPKLRIIDISRNDFTGDLPEMYLRNFKAMIAVYQSGKKWRYMGKEWYYQDSVIVTTKGLEIELAKILTNLMAIDFSSNRFQGKIPELIGNLNSLIWLNLSHNNLIGHIPSSLGNLRMVESLDLSSNNLIGRIPQELTSLTFLSVLNLSQNHLTGPIPHGKQFDTFENNSYSQNLGLCGAPLSKKCMDEASPQPPKEEDVEPKNGFGWKVVLMGYGCGLMFGLSMGCLMFVTGKPEWFVRLAEGDRYKKTKKSRRSIHSTRRTRR